MSKYKMRATVAGLRFYSQQRGAIVTSDATIVTGGGAGERKTESDGTKQNRMQNPGRSPQPVATALPCAGYRLADTFRRTVSCNVPGSPGWRGGGAMTLTSR
jgi:hypothetical protein